METSTTLLLVMLTFVSFITDALARPGPKTSCPVRCAEHNPVSGKVLWQTGCGSRDLECTRVPEDDTVKDLYGCDLKRKYSYCMPASCSGAPGDCPDSECLTEIGTCFIDVHSDDYMMLTRCSLNGLSGRACDLVHEICVSDDPAPRCERKCAGQVGSNLHKHGKARCIAYRLEDYRQ